MNPRVPPLSGQAPTYTLPCLTTHRRAGSLRCTHILQHRYELSVAAFFPRWLARPAIGVCPGRRRQACYRVQVVGAGVSIDPNAAGRCWQVAQVAQADRACWCPREKKAVGAIDEGASGRDSRGGGAAEDRQRGGDGRMDSGATGGGSTEQDVRRLARWSGIPVGRGERSSWLWVRSVPALD